MIMNLNIHSQARAWERENNISIDKDFFKMEYKHVNNSKKDRYSLDNWIKDIFINEVIK